MITKTKWLIAVFIIIAIAWIIVHIQNKQLSNKINNSLSNNISFSIQSRFANTQIACAIAPHYKDTQNIAEIRTALNTKSIVRLNRKISNWLSEDSLWHLVLIDNGEYKVYHIHLAYTPNFKNYQCISAKMSNMQIVPIKHSTSTYFELR